jgi:hypothetical protein
MDTILADDLWELNQKFESVVKPWATAATDKLRKFSDNAKLIVCGDEEKPHSYTVKFVVANYNYKDTESTEFWDPFVRVFGNSDFPKVRHMPRSVWAKIEKDAIMSHDEDKRLPGFPVTTLYDYEDKNSKMAELELCNFSKKHGEEWKELAEHTLDELTPNFIDKYIDKDVDYYPAARISSKLGNLWNIPLISSGTKTLQGKIKKVRVVVQSDRVCTLRFLIHANDWKKPTPNIVAEGIRCIWG